MLRSPYSYDNALSYHTVTEGFRDARTSLTVTLPVGQSLSLTTGWCGNGLIAGLVSETETVPGEGASVSQEQSCCWVKCSTLGFTSQLLHLHLGPR